MKERRGRGGVLSAQTRKKPSCIRLFLHAQISRHSTPTQATHDRHTETAFGMFAFGGKPFGAQLARAGG